ncbi:hypothetical protein [Kitasatospora sp. NPDC001095]
MSTVRTDPGNAPDQSTAALLHDFNSTYSAMLTSLEHAWGGNPNELFTAIGNMSDLADTAQRINAVKLPADPRFTYGPEWLFVTG